MRIRAALALLCLFAIAFTTAAQEKEPVARIQLLGEDSAQLEASKERTLTLKATTASGAAAARRTLKIQILNNSSVADEQASISADTVTTSDAGTAEFKLTTKTKTDIALAVREEPGEFTQEFYWRPIGKLDVTVQDVKLTPRTIFPEILAIDAKQKDGTKAASFQKLKISTLDAEDALVFVDRDGARAREIVVTTNERGKATVSLETGEDTQLQFVVTPINADKTENTLAAKVVESSGLLTFDSFHSKRLFTELFLGATFTNDYDENGKSTGISETGPLARVTFDTLWYDQRLPRPGGIIRGSLWHTGVDLELSDFPFGKDSGEDGDEVPGEGDPENPEANPKGLATAFSGSGFAVWQPDKWASYSQTSTRTGFPTDALRLGLFTRIGITTRPQAKANGDTSFWRGQIGVRFTHHQTAATMATREQDNVVPIRFVEVSYGRFEEFAGQDNANRLVLDAGFRLPGLGSNMIPFYAGIHLNAGRGADDLRIFAGFLFKINEIANAFQRAGVTP